MRIIKTVSALPNSVLSVQFVGGITKKYDVKPLFEKIPVFKQIKDNELFYDVRVDIGGHGII